MITDADLYRRRDRLLPAAFLFSLLVHVLGIAVYSIVQGRMPWIPPPQKREPLVVLSTATTIRHITVPQVSRTVGRTAHAPRYARSERVAELPQPAPTPRPTPRPVVPTPEPRRELAIIKPSAPPAPSPQPSRAPTRTTTETFAQRLEREQEAYRREIARLQQANNPLSAATLPPRPASSFRREYVNVSGIDKPDTTRGEGVVTPVRKWRENGLNCYYADYAVEFAHGGSEDGLIPWPLCYDPDHDMLALGEGALIPKEYLAPMRDYTLPAGTYLTQFLQYLYNEPRR